MSLSIRFSSSGDSEYLPVLQNFKQQTSEHPRNHHNSERLPPTAWFGVVPDVQRCETPSFLSQEIKNTIAEGQVLLGLPKTSLDPPGSLDRSHVCPVGGNIYLFKSTQADLTPGLHRLGSSEVIV